METSEQVQDAELLKNLVKVQKQWADHLIAIGKAKGDDAKVVDQGYRMLDNLYDFGQNRDGYILFKPTLAKADPVRTNFSETLSYFIGKKNWPCGLAEDEGFAIEPYPWREVKFTQKTLQQHNDYWVAMGPCDFIDAQGQKTTANFILGYRPGHDKKLRIFMHHSIISETAVRFESITDYFVNNTVAEGAHFLVLNTLKEFEQYFGFAGVMWKEQIFLTEEDFKGHYVVANIQPAEQDASRFFDVELSLKASSLVVSYKVEKEPITWNQRHPLILLVEKGKNKSVTFIENGTTKKVVPVGA